jgi:drug/metabolite transporter (DMT)-like permease
MRTSPRRLSACSFPAVPRPSSRTLAILALLGANLIWGTTFVATKPMLDRIPPVTLATARFGIALLVLLPLLARANVKPARGSTVALMGFTGVFLSYVCQNAGLQYTSATNGALIDGGIPVFTALIAVPLLRERLTWTRTIGIAASLAGVAVIVLRDGGGDLGLSFVGNTILLAGTVAAAAYFVLCRRAFPLGDSLALVAGVSRYGVLFLLPVSVIEVYLVGIDRPTAGDVLGLLYLGVAASALGFALWGYGLRHMEATPR